MPYDGDLIDDAFLMYRDCDGHGAQFGDEWTHSASADPSEISVFGAHRSSDGAETILVVNNSAGALTSPLTLTGIPNSGTAQVWQWTGGAIT
jgi:hypothetical protein